MAPLLGYLVKPKENVLEYVDDIFKEHIGKRIVGVQMRTTENYSEEKWLPIFNQCVSLLREDENTLFYISTDSVDARKLVEAHFPGKTIFFEESEINMKRPHGRYRTSVLHGIVDILALASSDDLVVSCGSSFSRIAVGLRRSPPVIVSRKLSLSFPSSTLYNYFVCLN